MEQIARFVVSGQGAHLLDFNGYLFRRNGSSENSSRTYFKCSRGCPATVIVSGGKIVKTAGFHRSNHKPSNHAPTNHVPAENEECSKKLEKFCELASKICPPDKKCSKDEEKKKTDPKKGERPKRDYEVIKFRNGKAIRFEPDGITRIESEEEEEPEPNDGRQKLIRDLERAKLERQRAAPEIVEPEMPPVKRSKIFDRLHGPRPTTNQVFENVSLPVERSPYSQSERPQPAQELSLHSPVEEIPVEERSYQTKLTRERPKFRSHPYRREERSQHYQN